MHIFFSGIGGTAIGPLALIAKSAGYEVSGSDKQDSQYIQYLRKKGLSSIAIGQTADQIAEMHRKKPIDWIVFSSAVGIENPDHPEIVFAQENGIKTSKRDELLNKIIQEKNLKLIAVAGTHGKTTTTAMVIWLFKQLGLPVSYSVGAKIPYGDMGEYDAGSQYFVYEADEFDRNFLAFEPYISLITGVSWDHHEIFTTREDYQQAFRQFIEQSNQTIVWDEDFDYLGLAANPSIKVVDGKDKILNKLSIFGKFNRRDALLAISALDLVRPAEASELLAIINRFPGLQRRMELIVPGLYSDYAHTPEKIRGAMSVALEMAQQQGKDLVVVHEPLTNRRQHYMIDDYKDCFKGAKKVYWVPSYLAREDPKQSILTPKELISHLSDPSIAEAQERDNKLKAAMVEHLDKGDMVVAMAGGGGGSLDEWVRSNFQD